MAKKAKPFTIAATGDLHIGLNVEELDRTPEALAAFDSFVDWCVEHKPDLAEIGGDVFDYNHPLSSHLAAVMQRLRRLDAAGITTRVMMGNHDAIVDPEQVWAGAPFQEAGYQNVVFYTYPVIINHGELRCMYLPHITRAHAVAKGFKTSQEYLETWARQQIDADSVDVVFSHLNVWCAKTGTEANMLRQSDLQLPAWLAVEENVGIIINHHIHTPQEFGKVFLPGSPICTDFGDVDSNKSFLVARLQENGWEIERVPTPQSPLQEFELDMVGRNAKEIAALEKNAMKLVLPDAIVKLRVLIEEERLSELDEEALSDRFRKACRWVKQVQKVPVRVRAVRDSRQHVGLEPKAAIELYLARAKPEGVDRKRELAMRIISGEKFLLNLGTVTQGGMIEELDAVLAKAEKKLAPKPPKQAPPPPPPSVKLSQAERRVIRRDGGVSLDV